MKRLILVIAATLLTTTSATADVAGRTFQATVIASFGGQFTDCYRFDNDGNLTVDLLFQTLTFNQDFFGNSPRSWQSTSRTGDPLAIAFHGFERDDVSWIGNGINEVGDTFVVFAFENPECTIASSSTTPAYKR